MINRIVLIGRITKDPNLHKTQSGTSVVSFTIAVNRRSKQEGQPDADFINCTAWNKTADLIQQYVHKGSQIGIDGRIQTRNYDGTDGKKVYVTEVVVESVQFLDSKGTQSNESKQTGEYSPQTETSDTGYGTADTSMIDNDDLPF